MAQSATLAVEPCKAQKGSAKLAAANQYIEQHRNGVNAMFRPSYHLAPPVGWINDPNGFAWFHGKYHLFAQFHPYSSQWGPMHWGHWVSDDLVRWTWLDVALAPDTKADEGGCFSGTSLQKDDQLYVMYTGLCESETGQSYQQQCLATSRDGMVFHKDEHNPVIDRSQLPQDVSAFDFRDPKLFRAKDGYRAVIAAKNTVSGGCLLVYSSSTMREWTYRGVFLGNIQCMPECPDVFELGGKTMVMASLIGPPKDGLRYPSDRPVVLFCGSMNDESTRFTEEQRFFLDYGMDFYAPQTLLAPDGRLLMVGWLQSWNHQMPTDYLNHRWNGCMSIIRELRYEDGRLVQSPVRELERFRSAPQTASLRAPDQVLSLSLAQAEEVLIHVDAKSAERLSLFFFDAQNECLQMDLFPAQGILKLDQSRCGYSTALEPNADDGTEAPFRLIDNAVDLRVYLDACSFEVFVNGGEQVLSTRVFPKKAGTGFRIQTNGDCDVQVTAFALTVEKS